MNDTHPLSLSLKRGEIKAQVPDSKFKIISKTCWNLGNISSLYTEALEVGR